MSRGLLALALPVTAGTAVPPPFPANSVLLLVAPWCAPCHGELARVETLAAAARPLALRVMAMEDGLRTRAMVRRVPASLRWEPPAETMRAARTAVSDRVAGLPYSIATNASGRVCADERGGLDEARMRAMVARCGD